MRFLLASLILLSVVAVQGLAFERTSTQDAEPQALAVAFAGRWRVSFTLSGIGENNLVFDSQGKGSGSFLLLGGGPDDKAAAAPLPAVWSLSTNDRVNFSGDVELPLGTCCREIGTLIFKGKFRSSNSIAGKVIFIGSTEDEENFNGYRSTVGTFTATRVLNK